MSYTTNQTRIHWIAATLTSMVVSSAVLAANTNQEGACCYELAQNVTLCQEVTADMCDAFGGVYYGDGTV
ncbi:MAG: hypothetical protein HOL13_05935 [Phycisphaerae bacterium]|nr:hypothetical protein [Phycisphaerae bacterium]